MEETERAPGGLPKGLGPESSGIVFFAINATLPDYG